MHTFSLVAAIVTILALESIASNHIQDHAIYKIANKQDNGVLTVESGHPGVDDTIVRLAPWSDGGGQKWKTKQPTLSKSFEFKPTSNDQTALNADLSNNIYATLSSGQDTKYWEVKYVGEGVYEMKNYVTGTCITSQGVARRVKLMPCDNSAAQQWAFSQL